MASTPVVRSTGVQSRSRRRVEAIVQAADALVSEGGAEALTTRAVAERAEVPVGSVYHYFADRDAILGVLLRRYEQNMSEALKARVNGLEIVSVRSIVETVVQTAVDTHRQRPAYPLLWFQARPSEDIVEFVRANNRSLAAWFHQFAVDAGLLLQETPVLTAELVAEMINAFLAVAFRDDVVGDDEIIAEGVEMMVRYLEPYGTRLGLLGIRRTQLSVPLTL
jgi:AcrR family transcriptional regulator